MQVFVSSCALQKAVNWLPKEADIYSFPVYKAPILKPWRQLGSISPCFPPRPPVETVRKDPSVLSTVCHGSQQTLAFLV